MSRQPSISVLMPVHAGVEPGVLRSALQSVWDQSLQPSEVVVVEDGPLGPEQHAVIESFCGQEPPLIRVVLPENRGPGVANQAGLLTCSGEWVAKADSDDISLPERLQRQWLWIQESGADVCGTAMLEFDGDPFRVTALRRGPVSHAAIARRMATNNPINNPSVMFRRELAVAVGGYCPFRFGEDYDLFARLLAADARMTNMDEPLVLFRAGAAFLSRRTARGQVRDEWLLQRNLHRYGTVGGLRTLVNFVVRTTFRRLPRPLVQWIYRRWLTQPWTNGG